MRFLSPQAANIAIRYGLILAGKHVRLRLLEPEPVRCLNCNQYSVGHIAANCPNKVVCGNCAGEHHTTTCPHKDDDHVRCSNCDGPGHAAWSRNCPEFIRRKAQLQNARGGGRYKYIVTKEEWTWEQIGDPRCDIPSNRPDADNRGISPPNTSRVRARSERTDPNGDLHNAGWLPTVGWLGQIGQDNAQAGPGPTTIA